jgi:putative ABC transport system permease protein
MSRRGAAVASAMGLRPSKIRAGDLISEAVAGLFQRPGRTALTALGTVLGVGAFVAVLGLTSSATNQVSKRFTLLTATEVDVTDAAQADGTGGSGNAGTGQAAPGTGTATSPSPDQGATADPNPFPADADKRVKRLRGVRAAGVRWQVDDGKRLRTTGAPVSGPMSTVSPPLVAASPGLLTAVHLTLATGRPFDAFHERSGEHVCVLGAAASSSLGGTSLEGSPAVLIDGVPFSVLGIIKDVARQPDLLFAVIIPRGTAEQVFGPPRSGNAASMVIDTDPGAAGVVAQQAALALRPEAPQRFVVHPPADPRQLQDQVSTDLSSLFFVLAGVCLVIGAVGIANTAMVSVLERVPEVGLRRALGARPRHIGTQFIVESAAVGTLSGLIGAGLGVLVVVGVSVAQRWTAVTDPATVLLAPLIGTAVGTLAGLYPAYRAARIEPIQALKR